MVRCQLTPLTPRPLNATMGKPKKRYAGRGVAGEGWRIWDNKLQRWWGEAYTCQPDELLEELNGAKRPERITELLRRLQKQRHPRTRPERVK